MSRRARMRAAHDKRATSLDLARAFGHDTPMPAEEAVLEEDDDGATWWPETPEDQRTPVGPVDVLPRHNESRA